MQILFWPIELLSFYYSIGPKLGVILAHWLGARSEDIKGSLLTEFLPSLGNKILDKKTLLIKDPTSASLPPPPHLALP